MLVASPGLVSGDKENKTALQVRLDRWPVRLRNTPEIRSDLNASLVSFSLNSGKADYPVDALYDD